MEEGLVTQGSPTFHSELHAYHIVQFDDVAVMHVQFPDRKGGNVGCVYQVPHLNQHRPEMGNAYKIVFSATEPLGIWAPTMTIALAIGSLPEIQLAFSLETLWGWIQHMGRWAYLQLFFLPRPQKLTDAMARNEDFLLEQEEINAMAAGGSWFIDLENHRKVITPWLQEGSRLLVQWQHLHHEWGRGTG